MNYWRKTVFPLVALIYAVVTIAQGSLSLNALCGWAIPVRVVAEPAQGKQ